MKAYLIVLLLGLTYPIIQAVPSVMQGNTVPDITQNIRIMLAQEEIVQISLANVFQKEVDLVYQVVLEEILVECYLQLVISKHA